MDVLQQFKCPCCDGAIEFNSTVQKMKCQFCDSEFDVADLQAYALTMSEPLRENMQWDTVAGTQWEPGETEGMRVYTCNSCGGEIVADETTGASECPFCGNPVVMTGQFAGDLRPDLVIPFKLDRKAAIEALKKHYCGKKLLPRVFKDQNRIKEVKGLYVPVWLFDTDAQGYVEFDAEQTYSWSDSNYDYTETNHYKVIRGGSLSFSNIPVDGSTKMDDALMESIEPFDITEAVDFQSAYLAGYLADRYDVDSERSIQRANERIKSSTADAFASTIHGYEMVIPNSTTVALENGRAKYALYPVWIMNTQWKGQKYTFAMNGQTGKLVGDLPLDKGAYRAWLFGLTGAISAAVFGLSYLLWLL